jgi:hypothetical protein
VRVSSATTTPRSSKLSNSQAADSSASSIPTNKPLYPEGIAVSS